MMEKLPAGAPAAGFSPAAIDSGASFFVRL